MVLSYWCCVNISVFSVLTCLPARGHSSWSWSAGSDRTCLWTSPSLWPKSSAPCSPKKSRNTVKIIWSLHRYRELQLYFSHLQSSLFKLTNMFMSSSAISLYAALTWWFSSTDRSLYRMATSDLRNRCNINAVQWYREDARTCLQCWIKMISYQITSGDHLDWTPWHRLIPINYLRVPI